MGFFDLFGKKKEVSGCTSCAGCAMAGRCSSASKPQISSVKVLGVGCQPMYENAVQAVKELGLNATVEYVTDMKKVHDYGVINIPGLAVDDNLVSMGRMLSTEEIKRLIL